ncbi:GntR family transcriptional regulator [Salinicola peritrichatus]|uniref:GntR family transcriptional regulator n=1 Tax=Salinicola peritrichatus TaxID=1267424 RepID=UPI000DA14DF3|nr:GntR family transcriptional regulator [Salinicola peritrichatus]
MRSDPGQTAKFNGRARYETIHRVVARAIRRGSVEPGQVLLEQPLSALFGTSRAPVRKALGMLHAEGLITRFDGRGYLVSWPTSAQTPRREPLTTRMLGLDEETQIMDTRSAGERVYGDIYRAVATCVVFGHYQINEQRAAAHFGVNRSAIREVLLRLRERGLVEKSPYSSWRAGPITARAIREDYELRRLLEPHALEHSASQLASANLESMLTRTERLITTAQPELSELEWAEEALHQQCLALCGNQRLLSNLRHAQTALTINRLFFKEISRPIHEPGLKEHRLVLQLLLDRQPQAAAEALTTHLERAEWRTLDRLKSLSVFPEPEMPDYVIRLS